LALSERAAAAPPRRGRPRQLTGHGSDLQARPTRSARRSSRGAASAMERRGSGSSSSRAWPSSNPAARSSRSATSTAPARATTGTPWAAAGLATPTGALPRGGGGGLGPPARGLAPQALGVELALAGDDQVGLLHRLVEADQLQHQLD